MRIAHGGKDFDVRSFECPKCAFVHVITVATDPMKSEAAGWILSDLNAPR